ncbi:MAG: YDG domain-containing protein [Christensenellales bacterium]
MNKSNRHNLIAILASLIAVVMIFGMAVVLGGDFGAYNNGGLDAHDVGTKVVTTARADQSTSGWIADPSSIVSSGGYEIDSEAKLNTFLKAATDNSTTNTNGNTMGRLTTNITLATITSKRAYNISSDWTLNGNGFTITIPASVNFAGNNYQGIFVQKNSGTINNLKVKVTGSYQVTNSGGEWSWLGVIAGANDGTISNVAALVAGTVYCQKNSTSEAACVGGIVGLNLAGGKLKNVFTHIQTNGLLKGKQDGYYWGVGGDGWTYVGGIIGENRSGAYCYGATFKTSDGGQIAVDGADQANKKYAGICYLNNGAIYGMVIDGTISHPDKGEYKNHTQGTEGYWYDANGAAYANIDLDSTIKNWYFTGESADALEISVTMDLGEGEYIYSRTNAASTGEMMVIGVNDNSIVKNQRTAYICKNMNNGTYKLTKYQAYDAFVEYSADVDNEAYTNLGTVSALTNGRDYTKQAPYSAKTQGLRIVFYPIKDDGTKKSNSGQTNSNYLIVSKDVSSTSFGPITVPSLFSDTSSTPYKFASAVAGEVYLKIIKRDAKIVLPNIMYDKANNRYNYNLNNEWKGWIGLSPSISELALKEAIAEKSIYVANMTGNGASTSKDDTAKVTTSNPISSVDDLKACLNDTTPNKEWHLTTSISITADQIEYEGNTRNKGAKYVVESGQKIYGNGNTITIGYSLNGGSTWDNNSASGSMGALIKTNQGSIINLNVNYAGEKWQMGVSGAESYTGLFVGENKGELRSVTVTNTGHIQTHIVSAHNNFLGIVCGLNSGTMKNVKGILNTSSNFQVGANSMIAAVGGVVGKNTGTIIGATFERTNGTMDATNQGGGTAEKKLAAGICPYNEGSIYAQVLVSAPSYGSNVSHHSDFSMDTSQGHSGRYFYRLNNTYTTTSITVGGSAKKVVKIDTSSYSKRYYFDGSTADNGNALVVKIVPNIGDSQVISRVDGQEVTKCKEYSYVLANIESKDSVGDFTITSGSVNNGSNNLKDESGRGFLPDDYSAILSAFTSVLAITNASSMDANSPMSKARVGGYTFIGSSTFSTNLRSALAAYATNYNISISMANGDSTRYYVVGNVEVTLDDYYHIQGTTTATISKSDSRWIYSIEDFGQGRLTIPDSAWLLGGNNYKELIQTYKEGKRNLSATFNKSLISISGIGTTDAKDVYANSLINININSTRTNKVDVYVSKKANSLNVYDLSTTPYTANVTWTYGATSDSDATPKYTFTIVCNDDMFKAIGGTFSPSLAIAGKPSNKITLSSDSFDSGRFSFDVPEGTMQEKEYYGANNTFDLNALYLYDMGIAANASVENKEAYLKAFLSGDISASRAYAGAQTLTLNADVTITSALGSAVIFNQYKTLNGNNKTVTLTSATGGNYASGDGTTYSTPGYPTNVIGYTNYVYRGGLAAVSCGTIQNVNIVLGGDLGTSTANAKSYAVGGVVGLNQGGSFSNVKVTVASNQEIGSIGQPSTWGTVIGVNDGGNLSNITVNGGYGTKIINKSGKYNSVYESNYYGYIGGVVGIMNLTERASVYVNFAQESTAKANFITMAAPSSFYNIYNMYLGDYETNTGASEVKAAIGLITATGYVSGQTRFETSAAKFSNIVFFNKTNDKLPFFAINGSGNVGGVWSAYGVLSRLESNSDPTTTSNLNNGLMYGTGITLKYDSYRGQKVLDMLDYTVTCASNNVTLKLNRPDIRLGDNSTGDGSVDKNDISVLFANAIMTNSTANTIQKTAILDMTLAVTTADGLRLFLLGKDASNQTVVGEGKTTDPLMAIINGIGIESDITINAWSNSTLLKVDAGRTLNGGNHTVTMNLTSTNKAYADYSSSDNWNGYKLVYDFIGVNDGTIQNLKFVGQVGNFSSYDVTGNHIIGSLVAVNNGTINSVTYTNNGIGTYKNSNSANVTIAGLVAGVNTGAITSTNVFNRALFSVWGTFAIGSSAAMGAIAGVNDGGYATGVKVFGDNAIELVSKTAKQTPEANNNTALYVGGVFGVASNDGAVSFATKTIRKHSTDAGISNAVISNANVIVAGGMGIRYSGGAINTYGSRGIFAGIVTSDPANAQTTMSGLAFMDMQTNPNLAVSYVYDAGVLSYFASDRIFNNSLSNGELTMMGYYGYDNGTTPDTSCVSGGKVDIVDYHGNSIFMYNYDATTNTNTYNGKTFLSGLQNYMNGSANTIEFDVKNVSSYLYVDDPMNMGIVCMSATLGGILTGTVLNYDTAKGLSGFATSTVNNVVSGVTYKYKWAIDPGRDSSNQSNIIQGFIEGKTATSFRAAGAALALTLTTDTEVSFAGLSAGRVLEAGRSINGGGYTLTVNVGSDTLDINEGNASNLYAVEGYDVVGVGGLFSAVQGVISDLNIVVNITGGTINATGTNLAVGGAVGIISGVTSTFGSVQVNVNGTTINFNDGGKTLAFGGAVGAIYNNGSNTSLTLNQNHTNYVYMKGVTMTGNAQNVAIGGAVGLLQGSMLQGGANPTVLYLSSLNRLAGTQGFDVTSTVSFSGTGGLGGLVGIMAGSTLQNINIDQGMSFAGTAPSQYLWTAERDMVWTLNGGSGSAVSAMGGAVGVSFSGNINSVGVNSRARLINNVGTDAGDATGNYIGGLLGLGSNSGDMSLTGTSDAHTETINGKTYTLTTTKINYIYAGQIGMIAMPDGGHAGYVTGRYINAKESYFVDNNNYNLRNIVWIDFTRKQADLYSKIQVFGATDAAGITLSSVAGMSVLGYVSTDMYNTLTQAGYNKSGTYADHDKLATYTKISAADFKGKDISIALVAYVVQSGTYYQRSLSIKLIGTLTTGGGGYTPYNTTANVDGTEYLRYWTAQIMAADNKTGLRDVITINSNILSANTPVSDMYFYTVNDVQGKHGYLRIQLFRNEVTITTEAQLKAFISNNNQGDSALDSYVNAVAGTLGANITLNQNINYYMLSKDLYGSGSYTITLAPSDNMNADSMPIINLCDASITPNYKEYAVLANNETPIMNTETRVFGLFVGGLKTGNVIEGVNFALNKQAWVTIARSNGKKPYEPFSMVAGIIMGINMGTIQNCTLELGASANFVVNRTITETGDNVFRGHARRNMCIVGGFAGMNIGKYGSTATVGNCTLNMNDSAVIRSICEFRRNAGAGAYPHAQAMAGGMVGWVGARSDIINSTLNGGGLIEATSSGILYFYSTNWGYADVGWLRTQTLASGAGALIGVNTNNYILSAANEEDHQDFRDIYDSNGNLRTGWNTQPYTNVRPENHDQSTIHIDGVIINWFGYTIEDIKAMVQMDTDGYRIRGMQMVDSQDRPYYRGDGKPLTGVEFGYRQIAGICDWETIHNVYLVTPSDQGTTTERAGWPNRETDDKVGDEGQYYDKDKLNSYRGTTLPAGTYTSQYVGRGGVLGATKSSPFELYVYDNTNPNNLILKDKTALGTNIGLSWAGTGIDADLSFDFTIADPPAEGKFLWDTQVWQVQPTSSELFNAKPEDAVVATEGDGWTSPSQPNLLFYNDVYDKINNMSDAIHYADVSHTFKRGNNVYLYYSYGTTGSASIDRNEYYYDSTTGVYYHKTTTSYGNSFGMPALKFYGSDGTEITNSSVSNTLFSSILVDRFTGKDPTNEANMTAVATTSIKDGNGNITGVKVNDPAAGSYRISFDTKSDANIGSAIKDISSKTIIFPENDIVSGKFKIVEIVTPLGLRAGDMTFIAEKGASISSKTNLHLDVAQILVGGVNVLSGNGNYVYNGIDYASKIDGIKPDKMTVTSIGMTDVTLNLEDWEYYGYVAATNSLGTNRSYLIAGSGFTLEYDFEDANNNSYTKLDGTDVIKLEVSGSQVTLRGRGLVIPVDKKIDHVQKTYDGSNSTNTSGSLKYGNVLPNSTSSTGTDKPTFDRYDDVYAGNGKTVYMNMYRLVFNGYKYKIDRYYQNSGFAMRAASSTNSNNTNDNWKNSVDVETNPTSSHQFDSAPLSISGSGALKTSSSGSVKVKLIGTILPQAVTINYIAKEYDGDEAIVYSKVDFSYSGTTTTGLQPKATFVSADVVYGGKGSYNSIVFSDIVTIVDQADNSNVFYAMTDANPINRNNYAIAANTTGVTYNPTAKTVTLAGLGIIVPQAVQVKLAQKTYDGNNFFVSGMTYNLAKVSNTSQSVSLNDMGLTSLSSSNGTFNNANVGDSKTITLSGTRQFEYPNTTLSNKYQARYFATSTAKNYAYSATTYTTGVIIPKQLTWKSNIKSLVNKPYDDTTSYTYASASTLFDGLASGDTTTKPTITFTDANVNTAGVEIKVTTEDVSIGGTTFKCLTENNNYYMTTNTATGMILPRLVEFSNITKEYDGTTTLSYTATTGVNPTTMTTSGAVDGVSLTPKGAYDDRHAYTNRQIEWTTTSFSYNDTPYNILQEAGSATKGKTYAGNYYVASNSAADITPCILMQADFLGVTAKQNKQNGTTNATGLIFTYFAGALYVISGSVNKKNDADVVDGEYALYKSGSLAGKNTDGTYDVGSYDINVTKLTGTDAGNYTLAVPFDLGQDLVINQQEVNSVAITVKPTNVNYNVDLPNAITPISSIAMDSVATDRQINATFTVKTIKWEDASKNAVSKGSPIGGYDLSVEDIEMSGNDNYKLAASATYTVTVTPSGAKALYILPLKNSITKVEKVYDGNTNLGTVTATQTISNYVGEYESKNVQDNLTTNMGDVKIKVKLFEYYGADGQKYTKYVIVIDNSDTMSNYYLDATVTDGYATLQVGVITPKEVTLGTVNITQSDSRGVVANDTKPAPGNFEYYSTATYSYSATLTGVISGDTVGVSITDPCGGTYNADTYDLTFNGLTGADAGNYTFNGTFSAQLTIKPQTLKNVSVSIKPINVVYGNAIPTTIDGATGSAVDYKSNEGVTGNFTISGFTTTATSTSLIGGYDITIDYGKVSLASNPNYVVGSTTTITVAVTPAEAKALYIIPADATLNSVTKTYDGTTTFTGATIVTTPASVAITGTYVDKNAGNGKSVYVDVAAFTYYNTLGAEVSVDIFKATNYKVANTHTTNASVATIDGVGVINKYAIKGSEIKGVTVTQTWKGTPSTTSPFTYYYTAKYVATGKFDLFNAYGDTVTVTLGIYKSTDSGYTNVSGTTNVGVGTYKISLLSVSATPDDNFTVATGEEQYSNVTTFKIDPQVVNNVYVVGNHFATTYTGAPLTYDKSAANFKIYAIDLDDREVNISGGIKENGLTMGVDGQTFATSQTQVGIYNVKVSVNGSAEGNNYTFSAIDNADVYIDQAKTAKTEFAIIPMEATLETAHKTYDGNNTLTGDIVIKFIDANSAAIDFGTATVSATFDSANAGNRKLVFVTKEFAYYPTGTTTKSTLNIIQTSTTTPAEGEGEASVSTTFTNYHIGSSNTVDGVAYIIPKLVDLSSPSKPYDGTTALGGEVSATGTVGGEKISISGSFDDCNAGENIGITINVTDMELGGVHYNALSGNTNYCIAANNYKGTITPRDIESSHLSLLQLARLDAKDGDKQVDMLNIAGIEDNITYTNSVEYTSKYKYQGIGGHLYVAADKTAEPNGNWLFKLYQAFAIEQEKGLTFSVTMLDKNGTEVEFAQNSGAYTIKVVFGGGNYKVATITKTFTITQQEVTDAANIYVYMDSFEGVYGQGNFRSPSASGEYRIGIVDKVSGDIVEFVKGAVGHNFAIGSLAFSKQGGTANKTIEADENGIYIGGYYLFAASVTGESDNFDTSKLDLSAANKKIYGIGKSATDENQSLYYIIPAELDLTSVTKTYDGTVAFTDGSKDPKNVTEFTYGSGVLAEDRTMRLVGEFVDFNATHNNAGTSGTKGAVKIATEIMQVTTLSETTNYNIVLKEGGVKTNYYLAIGSAETMIEVTDKAIIKKYKIENGAIQLSVQGYEGYLADSENKVTKYINAPTDTIEFTYANGYRYNDKFVITGLQPIAGQGLFNAADDINAMSVILGPDNVSNASDNPYELVVKSFTASNYEWGSNATIGKLKINKQLVNEDSIAISIPPLALEYNGNVQKPEGVDKFSFTVKDFYTGLSAKADGAGGSGVSGIKYYMNSVEVPNPTDIGGYSVSVVVDTSYIDTNNYTMADGVSSITKQADNGNAVFFILPKALTVESVTKQYDGTENFVDIQVNGVKADSVADPKTIITIDEGGFVKESDKNIVYNAIIAKGGYFGSKDIAETESVVYFTASSFSYRTTVDGVVTGGTAYYIYGTNYMVPRASVGHITPAHLTITGMTKTYDGTTALQFEYSYDSNTKVGINKTTERVTGAMKDNKEPIRPAGEYESSAVGTNIAVKFNVTTETVINGVTYYRLVNNDLDGGESNASNYYIFTSNDSVIVKNGMITIEGIGTIKAIAISDGTTSTTADASISNITIDGKAYDSTSAFIYNYSKSYGIADLKATFKFFGGELTCQGTYNSTKGLMEVEGIKDGDKVDKLYFSITFTKATETNSAQNAGEYTIKIKLVTVESDNNNAYEFGTDGKLTLSKRFKINKYQLKQDELKIKVAALEREYDGKEGITTDGSDAKTWVAGKVESTLTYTITLSGATTTSKLTISSVKKTNETQTFINVGKYALQVQVTGYDDTNYMLGNGVYYNLYSQANESTEVFQILPKKITLETETVVVKNFDGTVSYLFDAGIKGEQVLLGNTTIAGEYARAGVHTLENTTFNVLDVVLDPTVKGFNSTLYNEETKVLDRATAKGNYVVVGTTTYKLTINPSNIVVAERRYDYNKKTAEIEVAITGLADTQFLNNNVDKTNLAGVLKISVNSFASFEVATTDEIVESSIKTTESLDALGYSSYTITFTYRAKGTLDAATYTDRYVFAVAGATDGYSTNLALTSSELADGQMGGAANNTGTAVATAKDLADKLKANANISLTANIYGWDASLLDSVVNYTGTLYGNGYSIQLAGGLNSDKDKTNGGAFIASLGGTIQDVNFKFTSTQTLSATNVGLVVGNMTGNMTNVSLDIINTPTIDGAKATTIGGFAGIASGSMTNATVIFNASVNNANFGGLVGSATNANLTNVSVRAYNGKTTTGKTLVATQSGCTFNGVIDMIGSDLGVSGITNLYTVNTSLTSAKAYGKLELLTPHTEGFIEYYFTTLNKTGVKTHNVYGGGASERDKTMYQTYGTIENNDTIALAIETLAPRNRFIWEAYSHSYQTEVAGGGHINLSLNRYVAMMPIGTVIEANGYTLDGQSKTDMSFITAGVTMFCPAIGIRGGQEIAASGSTIKEAVYTGEVIEHSVTITETKEDGTKTEKKVIVSATDVGYYDNIVVELKGDVTTDDINYDTSNRTAIVAAIGDGTNVAGAILIIYPKQSVLPTNFSKYYDTTSIGEFTTTVDGKSVTLLGTYVDAQGKEASDVDIAKWVSFANNSNAVRKVLVDKNGNYIAQHHKTDANGTTYSYTKIIIEKNGIDVVFNKGTTLDGVTNDALMKAMAQLIDYDQASKIDNSLDTNIYTYGWVYNVTALGYTVDKDAVTFNNGNLYYVPETINDNAGNFTFTANGLTAGSLNNISTTEPSAFAVFAGTTSSNASITPAQREATYTIVNADKLSFRTTHTKDTVKVAVKTWNLSAYESTHPLPTQMTAKQREAFSDFMSDISADDVDTLSLMSAESGSKIIDNGGSYSIAYTASDKYFAFKLPTTITKNDKDATAYGNYVIVPDSKVIEFRYFIVNANGEFELSTYKDVLMIGERAVVDIDDTQYESNYHKYAYKMTGNINMKSSLITPFDWGNGIAFEGSIDGAGFALTNYILKGENNVGLFAEMASGASVTNLIMGNVMVVATASSGEVKVSALTTSTVGTITDVATEMRVVTATTGSVTIDNAGQSFVRVHKQSGSNVTVSTLLNGTPKVNYLKPSDIDALTKFGGVANFLGKYVLNNAKLKPVIEGEGNERTLRVEVNNFREYWGWYNICPWLEGGNTWNGIRPTKSNVTISPAA